MTEPVLSVRGLVCRFEGGSVTPLNGVTFDVLPGETFAVVGESGSGKSTLARAVAGLERPSAGEIVIHGGNAPGHVQMVFQDAGASLNPRWRVASVLAEPMILRFGHAPDRAEIAALLARVGLAETAATRYPHEFSGGEQQRIAIARAISTRPALLLCDEPTSALDASAQAQVLNLLAGLQGEMRMACLLVSHDLAVVSQVAHRIGVLFQGRLCETGDTRAVLAAPTHAYTRALRDAAAGHGA